MLSHNLRLAAPVAGPTSTAREGSSRCRVSGLERMGRSFKHVWCPVEGPLPDTDTPKTRRNTAGDEADVAEQPELASHRPLIPPACRVDFFAERARQKASV